MHTSSDGGSAETEQTALTVTPARPAGPSVVTTETGEASRLIPLERLAVSPQCGFSTSIVGNLISVEDEKRKLKRVVEAARAVWG